MLVKLTKALERIFFKSWWLLLFVLGCYMLYEQGMRTRDINYENLFRQWHALQNEKISALAVQEDLLLKINSQSDPAYVELTLMKGLGLVPEGQIKVLFVPAEK